MTTDKDLFKEQYVYGSEHPDEQWILTSEDRWVANPHYEGPPQEHPESFG